MSLLAPGFLIAAAAAALGVLVLHFIVTRRPRSIPLPTARFVPDVPVAATSRSVQLSDLLLLAIRVLAILLAGAALARPVFTIKRQRVVRVIAADVSGSAAHLAEVRDSVRKLFRPGDALVEFDTLARAISSPDSIGGAPAAARPSPGSISAGLVAALRSAPVVRNGADSLQLVIVSPVTVAESDRATDAIRAAWPGRAMIVPVAAAEPTTDIRPAVPFVPADPTSRPAFSVPRNRIDTIGAVVAGGNVVVGSFERRWRFTPDSLLHARVIARWADGEPAAIERDSGAACARSAAIPIDTTGDMILRPQVVRLLGSLRAACGIGASARDPAAARLLAGRGRLAAAADFPPAADVGSPLARWLLGMALMLAIAEMLLRRSNLGPER